MNDTQRRGFWSRYFHGRRPGPLVGPWVGSAIIAAAVYYFQRTLQALDAVASFIYLLLAAIVFVVTARWLRARSADRRTGERRRLDRRAPED